MFNKNYIIKGIIKCETGLHIGDSSDTVEIGGSDSPIVRDAIDNYPYIPGSSLKGKLRSLFELSDPISANSIIENAKNNKDTIVSTCEDCDAVKLFGTTPEETKENNDKSINYKTRLIVRDSYPTKSTINLWKENDDLLNGAELKWENTINRITSKAVPRNIERVPKGSEFNFEMIISNYDGEDTFNYLEKLLSAMYILENDYLGGSGSRGSGQISFNAIKVFERSLKFYTENAEENLLLNANDIDEALKIVREKE